MVIASEWNMREFLRGVYFPPSLLALLIARGALEEEEEEEDDTARGGGKFRSAQLHLLRADTLVRAAFNVLTANGLASRGGIVRHLGYRERGRVRGRFVRGVS